MCRPAPSLLDLGVSRIPRWVAGQRLYQIKYGGDTLCCISGSNRINVSARCCCRTARSCARWNFWLYFWVISTRNILTWVDPTKGPFQLPPIHQIIVLVRLWIVPFGVYSWRRGFGFAVWDATRRPVSKVLELHDELYWLKLMARVGHQLQGISSCVGRSAEYNRPR